MARHRLVPTLRGTRTSDRDGRPQKTETAGPEGVGPGGAGPTEPIAGGGPNGASSFGWPLIH